jgi:hypothetical protein
VKNGRTVFCRREVVLGSHFGADVCGTADELDKTTANAKETVADMQRRGVINFQSK